MISYLPNYLLHTAYWSDSQPGAATRTVKSSKPFPEATPWPARCWKPVGPNGCEDSEPRRLRTRSVRFPCSVCRTRVQ